MPASKVVSRVVRERTSVELNVVLITCPKSCRQRSKVRVVQTARVRRKISTVRGSLQTVWIRCGGAWMRMQRAAMGSSSRVSSRAASKDNNRGRDNSRGSNRDRGNRRKDSSKVPRVVNKAGSNKVSRKVASSLAARKTAVVHRVQDSAAARIVRGRWEEMAGATAGNFRPRFESG